MTKDPFKTRLEIAKKKALDRENNKKPSRPNAKRGKKLDTNGLNPDILALEQSISEKTGLKVEVRTKDDENGSVAIHYKTLEQFDHIIKKLTS